MTKQEMKIQELLRRPPTLAPARRQTDGAVTEYRVFSILDSGHLILIAEARDKSSANGFRAYTQKEVDDEGWRALEGDDLGWDGAIAVAEGYKAELSKLHSITQDLTDRRSALHASRQPASQAKKVLCDISILQCRICALTAAEGVEDIASTMRDWYQSRPRTNDMSADLSESEAAKFAHLWLEVDQKSLGQMFGDHEEPLLPQIREGVQSLTVGALTTRWPFG